MKKRLLFSLFFSLITLGLSAQWINSDFAPFIATTGIPRYLHEHQDNKLLVAGSFSYVNDEVNPTFTRLLPNGDTDPDFVNDEIRGGFIRDVDVMSDERILLAGSLNFNNEVFPQLSILTEDGQLDEYLTFDETLYPPYIAQAKALPDGSILISGSFDTIAGQVTRSLARINTDGELLQSFINESFGAFLPFLEVEPDGSFIAGGTDGPDAYIQRFLPNGQPDPNFFFNPQLDQDVGLYQVRLGAVGPNDLYAFTGFSNSGDVLLLLDEEGNVEHWELLPGTVLYLGFDPGGNLLISMANGAETGIYLFSPTDGFTPYFSAIPSLDKVCYQVLFADDGIYLAGEFQWLNSTNVDGLAKVDGVGNFFPDYSGKFLSVANMQDAEPLPDGRILIAGNFDRINGQPWPSPAILFSDGSIDESFQAVTGGQRFDFVELRPNGRVLAGYGPIVRQFLPDGTVDPSFNLVNEPYGGMFQMELLPSGDLYVYGYYGLYDEFGNQAAEGIACFSENGTFNASFSERVRCLEILSFHVQDDGNLLLGGSSPILIDGQYTGFVQRVSPEGEPDPTFLPWPDPTTSYQIIFGLNEADDGKIIVAGAITEFGGQEIPHGLMRLNPNGTPDFTFNSGGSGLTNQPGGIVLPFSLKTFPNGDLLIGGYSMEFYNDEPVNSPIRVDKDGEAAINYELPITGSVVRTFFIEDSTYIAVGNFRANENDFHTSVAIVGHGPVSSVEEVPANPIQAFIFPNPTTDFALFQLDSYHTGGVTIQLRDAQGRLLNSWQFDQASGLSVPLDMQPYPAGQYMLSMYIEGKWYSRQIIRN